MNNKSALSTVQTVILIGAALYVVLPDFFIGPVDDTVIALITGIAEVVLGLPNPAFPNRHRLSGRTSNLPLKETHTSNVS